MRCYLKGKLNGATEQVNDSSLMDGKILFIGMADSGSILWPRVQEVNQRKNKLSVHQCRITKQYALETYPHGLIILKQKHFRLDI